MPAQTWLPREDGAGKRGGGHRYGARTLGSSFPQCNSSQEGWRWDPRGTSLGNSCPSSSADLSEAKHPVKTSSWAWQAKGSFMPTPPRIPAGNLVMQEVSSGPHGSLDVGGSTREGHPVVGMELFQNSPLRT